MTSKNVTVYYLPANHLAAPNQTSAGRSDEKKAINSGLTNLDQIIGTRDSGEADLSRVDHQTFKPLKQAAFEIVQ